jgi:hypothetical protein
MSNTIGEVNINLRMSMASFRQDVQQGTQEAGKSVKDMSQNMREQTDAARGSLALMGEEFGIHIPRHLRTMIATLPGVGTALSAAFNSVAVLALIGVVVTLGEKFYAMAEKSTEALKKVQDETDKTIAETKKLIETNLEASLSPADLASRKIAITKQEAEEASAEIERLTAKIKDMLSQTYRVGTGQGETEEKHLYDETSKDIKALESQRDAAWAKVQGYASTQLRNVAALSKADDDIAKKAEEALLKRIALERLLAAEQFKARQAARAAFDATQMETKPYADKALGDASDLQSQRQGPTAESTFGTAIIKANEEVLKEAAKVYQSTRTNAELYSETVDHLNQLLAAGVISQDTYSRAVGQAKNKYDDLTIGMNKLGESVGKTIIQGQLWGSSWKQSLSAIAVEIAQLIIKMELLNSITPGKSGKGAGGFFSSLLSGFAGLAEGGPVNAGQTYMVGEQGPELFRSSVSGRISPLLQGSGGSVVSNVYYQIDARGADTGAEQRIRIALKESEDRAVMRAVATTQELSKRT